MNVEIVSQPRRCIVGFKTEAPLRDLGRLVPEAWLKLVAELDRIHRKVEAEVFYGIFPESDQLHDGRSGLYTYWVGVEVEELEAVPQGMEAVTIPAQRYAMTTCRGPAEDIWRAYGRVREWLRAEGWTTNADSFGFERYDSRRQRVTPPYQLFDFDIYKPLKD